MSSNKQRRIEKKYKLAMKEYHANVQREKEKQVVVYKIVKEPSFKVLLKSIYEGTKLETRSNSINSSLNFSISQAFDTKDQVQKDLTYELLNYLIDSGVDFCSKNKKTLWTISSILGNGQKAYFCIFLAHIDVWIAK